MRMRLALIVPLVVVAGLVSWSWRGAPHGHQAANLASDATDLAEAAGVHPDTLVVDFRDDVSAAALAANAYVEEPISHYSAVDKLYRIHFASADEAAQAAASLRRDPDVESVDYDVEASIPPGELEAMAGEGMSSECSAGAETKGFPNDPCFRYQWHLRQVGMPDAWKLGQGKGVVVAVIDTGVTQVPDLKDTKLVKGYNFVADNDDATDDHGHGTHVAGTIAQATNNALGVGGVAFGASIMPLKVLSADGRGSMGAIAQAIRWAGDHGAKVINMSLGGPFPVGTIKSAVDYARSKGVVVVAAAGNDGRGRVSYPARYPGVVAVAATQFDEATTFYSNWGKEIDLAAPGGNTKVDQNGDGKPDGVLQNTVVPGNTSRTDYLFFMGTSMASPHVAGVAALVMGAGVTKPDAVEAVLLGTARKPKGKSDVARIDDRYGAGIVDAGAALKKARAGRDASSAGLAGAIALLGLGALRRQRRLGAGLGLGFAASLLAGSVALPEGLTFASASLFGNPLVMSALLPLALVGVFYGVAKLRPWVAGLCFGIAGLLTFGALAATTNIVFVPDFLDRAWLLANAALAALLGTVTLRRSV